MALDSAAANVWPLLALAGFGGALVASWLLTPLSAKAGERLGLIDHPGQARKRHKDPTPRSGGLAVAAAFYGTILGGFALGPLAAGWLGGSAGESMAALLANAGAIAWPAGAVLGGGLAMMLLGLADDRLDLPALPKLFAQIACAALLWASGVRASAFLPEPLGFLLTVGWVVALVNAFNFLDNMNGLSSGVAALAAGAFSLHSMLAGEWLLMAAWAALSGACGGFWIRNFFFGRPFLGDGGTLLIGFLTAALALRGTYYEPGAPTGLPVLVPPILLALPIFDAASVLWIRFREGRPLMKGDRCHLSHRLVEAGFSPRGAVLAHYLLGTICALIAWALRTASRGPALGLVGAVILLFWFLYLLEQAASRRIRSFAEAEGPGNGGPAGGTHAHDGQGNASEPSRNQGAPARGAKGRGHRPARPRRHRGRRKPPSA